MFMAAADQTLLATATPAIADSLGGLRDASWIAVGYLLASATIVPLYGRLGDIHGRRKMLLIALGIFTLGSAACGAAQTLPQLVAARVLQGLGGGGLMTLSQALIGELVPPRERIRFQGYFALVFTSASIGGPVIGGLVVSHWSWRWLFFANLPFAAFAAWRLMRLPAGEVHPPASNARDFIGQILFAITAVGTLYWLTQVGHRFEWASAWSIALATLAVLGIATLVWHERRQAAPFLPVELLRDRTVALSTLLTALFAASLFAMIFFLPIYLQLGHKVSAQLSGLLLVPVTLGMVCAALTAARLLRRTGEARRIPLGGMSLAATGLLLLGVLPDHPAIVIGLGFLTGLGLGSVMPINQVVVQTVAGRARLGAATSLMGLARSTGGAAGAALFGAVVFALMPHMDVVSAFHRAFLVAAGIAILGAFVASRIPRVQL
jgi:EmrB/QacA subfamily drug resistance transporter